MGALKQSIPIALFALLFGAISAQAESRIYLSCSSGHLTQRT